jgi:small subunit ribosomal protein S4
LRLFDKDRIERERELLKKYGLKNKREIWRAETLLRNFRRLARRLAARKDEKVEKELLNKLARLGILPENATLDDVLKLTVEDILNRRLQTVITKMGLANTVKQARQMIVHGHIQIENRRVVFPSYLVPKGEESKIKATLKVVAK